MTPDTQIGIIEMGANHHGEIKQLCKMTEPDFGLVTNVGKAHLEGFGNIEDIAKAKAELFEYLKNNNGTIFGNAGNSYVNAVIPQNYNNNVLYGITNSICWGQDLASDPFLKLILFMSDNPSGTKINTNLVGRYNLENVVAAATFAHFLDISISIIKQAVENYFPEENRSQLIKTDVLFLLYLQLPAFHPE